MASHHKSDDLLRKPATASRLDGKRTSVPKNRPITTIATNPHFQLLQLDALFAILAAKEISSCPARLFISQDCQITTEK